MGIDRRHLPTAAARAAAVAGAVGLAPPGPPAAAAPQRPPGRRPTSTSPKHRRPRPAVRTGVQRLISSRYAELRGQRVGVITNPTAILPDLRHAVDVMHGDDAIHLVAVFGPEHGFRGTAQAGGSEGFYHDPRTGLPVYDTYLKSGQELADIIVQSGVDTVIFDIQDVGARFYTYIWTLYDSMVAAAMAGKRFVVLDRPNAISGRQALGPVLHPGFETFVGRKPVAQSHGMTVAELARLFNGEWVAGDAGGAVELAIVEIAGWSREMFFDDTGLPWVPPSPNMPTVDSAVVYPGTGMFEGTTLSEGRGTTRPFEQIGAPYGDRQWRDALTALELPGAGFRENYFVPTFDKWDNQTVGGVELYVTDRTVFDPVHAALAMLVTAKQVYPAGFGWRPDNWIDKLTGSDYVRMSVEAGKSTDAIAAGWQGELADFRRLRAKYLIYDAGDR